MTTPTIFPDSELLLSDWLLNYKTKLTIVGASCGLGAAEITATLVDVEYYIFMLRELHHGLFDDTHKFTDYKQLMINECACGNFVPLLSSDFSNMPPAPVPGIRKRLLEQIARIKASYHYTDFIGHELGISSEDVIATIASTKQFIGVGNRVRKDIVSYDYEGVWIESHLNGADWAFFYE